MTSDLCSLLTDLCSLLTDLCSLFTDLCSLLTDLCSLTTKIMEIYTSRKKTFSCFFSLCSFWQQAFILCFMGKKLPQGREALSWFRA